LASVFHRDRPVQRSGCREADERRDVHPRENVRQRWRLDLEAESRQTSRRRHWFDYAITSFS
jgi:hypothetical protein